MKSSLKNHAERARDFDLANDEDRLTEGEAVVFWIAIIAGIFGFSSLVWVWSIS
jgi:DNA topoisomerase IA